MNDLTPGLSGLAKKEWKGGENTISAEALDRLQEEPEFHSFILDHLQARVRMSEEAMSRHHSRWQAAEQRFKIYLPEQAYSRYTKAMNDYKENPEKYSAPLLTDIVVPYTYATTMTIVTYLMQAFAGHRPMFGLGSNSGTAEDARIAMELLLQWNVDHERLIGELYQKFLDGQIYGVGITRTAWKQERKMRTVWIGGERKREQRLIFQGTHACAVDPFMFLPDPRVPMAKVNKQGEFVFFRSYQGKHELLSMQEQGLIKGADRVQPMSQQEADKFSKSLRGVTTSDTGLDRNVDPKVVNFVRVDQGTVTLIPREMGLGPEVHPTKWIFTILNGHRIVQAEPFDTDHDMHPCSVTEPYSQGYEFGHQGMVDKAGQMQDTLSWFVNSHIRNVRGAINNMFVVDPSKVEMQDVLNPAPGKVIRLKRAAYGQDVKQAIQQLQVADITRGHVADLQVFMRMADGLTGITDNLRGLQDSGGRKTASEVRITSEAGASRLAVQARLISSQAIADTVDQMICNFQQYGTDEFAIQVLGAEKLETLRVKPEQIAGDFYFPIHDGTLPIDKVAMLDIWVQIFQMVLTNPQAQQEFDTVKIFEHVAELGGVKNLSSFRRQQIVPNQQIPASPEQIAGGEAKGNIVPISAPELGLRA